MGPIVDLYTGQNKNHLPVSEVETQLPVNDAHIQGVPGECARRRENVSHIKVHRYNPKHLYPKLNGYGDNGQRSLKV